MPDEKRQTPTCLRLGIWCLAFCWTYLLVVLSCWLLLYAADLWWPATLFLFSPRWVLLLPLAALVPMALLLRRRALILLGVAALVVAGPVMGFCIPWARLIGSAPAGPRLRVLTCNMHYTRNLDGSLLKDVLAAVEPDVIALQEWDKSNHWQFRGEHGWHVHRTERLFLASRYPIVEELDLGPHSGTDQGSIIRYDLQTPAGKVAFFSLHFASPRQGLSDAVHDSERGAGEIQAGTDLRWMQSQRLAEFGTAVKGPVLLAGDFNTPPQSAIFRRVWGGYTDAFSVAGWGWGYTFRALRTAVRIDHILAGPGWYCQRCWVGPFVGSPHRPVVAELVWTGRP
jgi:endonuclease/exonuclease/phosphatase (EEP) superfamily protein YafD